MAQKNKTGPIKLAQSDYPTEPDQLNPTTFRSEPDKLSSRVRVGTYSIRQQLGRGPTRTRTRKKSERGQP